MKSRQSKNGANFTLYLAKLANDLADNQSEIDLQSHLESIEAFIAKKGNKISKNKNVELRATFDYALKTHSTLIKLVAADLFYRSRELFLEIQPDDITNITIGEKAPESHKNIANAMTNLFQYVISEILNATDSHLRTYKLYRWTLVMNESYGLGDYPTVSAILAALNDITIDSLFNELPEDIKHIRNALTEPFNNATRLNNMINLTNNPVPSFNVIKGLNTLACENQDKEYVRTFLEEKRANVITFQENLKAKPITASHTKTFLKRSDLIRKPQDEADFKRNSDIARAKKANRTSKILTNVFSATSSETKSPANFKLNRASLLEKSVNASEVRKNIMRKDLVIMDSWIKLLNLSGQESAIQFLKSLKANLEDSSKDTQAKIDYLQDFLDQYKTHPYLLIEIKDPITAGTTKPKKKSNFILSTVKQIFTKNPAEKTSDKGVTPKVVTTVYTKLDNILNTLYEKLQLEKSNVFGEIRASASTCFASSKKETLDERKATLRHSSSVATFSTKDTVCAQFFKPTPKKRVSGTPITTISSENSGTPNTTTSSQDVEKMDNNTPPQIHITITNLPSDIADKNGEKLSLTAVETSIVQDQDKSGDPLEKSRNNITSKSLFNLSNKNTTKEGSSVDENNSQNFKQRSLSANSVSPPHSPLYVRKSVQDLIKEIEEKSKQNRNNPTFKKP